MGNIIVPDKCLSCGSDWMGGCQLPGKPFPFGVRVFYNCGASMSVKKLSEDAFQILFKNCCAEFEDHSIDDAEDDWKKDQAGEK